MATKTEHELVIKANAKQAVQAGKDVQKAFTPVSMEAMLKMGKMIERQLGRLGTLQLRFGKQLKAQFDDGGKASKQLNAELQQMEARLKRAEAAMKSFADQAARAGGGGPGGGPVAGGGSGGRVGHPAHGARRQGFLAGFGQAVGLGPYIPTGPEMLPRMGGSLMGAIVNGVVGAGKVALAPFLNPGPAGIATILSSIPGFGTAAAGAFQQAQGYYQSAVGHHQARLGNLQYMGGPNVFARGASLRDFYASGGGGGAAGAELKKAQLELSSSRDQMRQIVSDWHAFGVGDTSAMSPEARNRYQKMVSDQGQDGRRRRGIMRAANAEQKIMGMSGGAPGAFAAAGIGHAPDVQSVEQEYFANSLAANYKRSNAAKERIQKAKEAVIKENASAWAKAAGGLGGGSNILGAGFGTEFGYMPTQVQGMIGQFMGARGGIVDKGVAGDLREAMAAQLSFGVGMSTSGGYYRMGTAGGSGGGMTNMANVLRAAVEQGLKGSLVTEYLDTLVSLGKQAEQKGMKVDVTGFTQSSALLSSMGVQGPQLGQLTSGFQGAAMGMSQTGINNPMSMLMYRAFGYDPSKGPGSFFSASNRMARGMDPEALSSFLGMVTSGAGANPEMQEYFLRQGLGSVGMNASPESLKSILGAYNKGELTGNTNWEYSRILGAQGGENRSGLITGAGGLARRGAGLAVSAAGMEAQRIGIGGELSGTMIKLEQTTITMVRSLSNFKGALDVVADAMKEWAGDINKFTKGGLSGIWEKMSGGGASKGGAKSPR